MSEKVDVSKLRRGDWLHVRAIVTGEPDMNGMLVVSTRDQAGVFIGGEDIVSVEPRALKVGDRVITPTSSGELLSICDEYGWVKLDAHQPLTYELSRLKRAP